MMARSAGVDVSPCLFQEAELEELERLVARDDERIRRNLNSYADEENRRRREAAER